jgi:hypothetical protein
MILPVEIKLLATHEQDVQASISAVGEHSESQCTVAQTDARLFAKSGDAKVSRAHLPCKMHHIVFHEWPQIPHEAVPLELG